MLFADQDEASFALILKRELGTSLILLSLPVRVEIRIAPWKPTCRPARPIMPRAWRRTFVGSSGRYSNVSKESRMKASPSTVPVITHRLAPDGAIPNHPRWPLLVYPGAVAITGPDPAAMFEALFERNRWPAAWRDGVFPFHHFHSNAHEALGVYSGEVTVQFGGDRGVAITARPGDVIVLPAGTGHKKISSHGPLGIVGAYPAGQHPDTCTPLLADAKRRGDAVARVPLPDADPVYGVNGPLFAHWLE
jgi:uncharacterized protein YjlB